MIKALELLAPAPYTPKGEEGKGDPARFILKPLSGLEALEVQENLPGTGLWNAAATKAAVMRGLVGWENFNDSAGPVPFLADMNANIARLPAELLIALRREISARTWPGEEDKKK